MWDTQSAAVVSDPKEHGGAIDAEIILIYRNGRLSSEGLGSEELAVFFFFFGRPVPNKFDFYSSRLKKWALDSFVRKKFVLIISSSAVIRVPRQWCLTFC